MGTGSSQISVSGVLLISLSWSPARGEDGKEKLWSTTINFGKCAAGRRLEILLELNTNALEAVGLIYMSPLFFPSNRR